MRRKNLEKSGKCEYGNEINHSAIKCSKMKTILNVYILIPHIFEKKWERERSLVIHLAMRCVLCSSVGINTYNG